MNTFAASVKKWTEKAKRNAQLVIKEAAQNLALDLHQDVGSSPGLTPFLTGNLRRSLMASTASMPSVKPDAEFAGDNLSQINMTIDGWPKDGTLWLGFQAAYARRLEYGFTGTDSLGRSYNQAGRFYVAARANKWQQYVDAAAAKIGDA